MTEKLIKDTLKVMAGQVCQTIGWHAINSSSLEILVDVLHRYLSEITKTTHLFADQFGRTRPNLDDLGLAFSEMGIEVRELREYVQFVEPVPCALSVPKFPVHKESHLNFLKPGSQEVVTRPVHVNEHLPPTTELTVDTSSDLPGSPQPTSPTFKRPGEPIDGVAKRARLGLEEEGRPLREISSVMMTTGGFISPAREGKLPEPKLALPVDTRSSSPPPQRYSPAPPEIIREKKKKMAAEGGKERDKPKKEKKSGEQKKLVSMKDLAKLKALKKPEKSLIQKLSESPHLVVTPIPVSTPSEPPPPPVVKLATEPDKQKLNIFKKISKVKEEEPVIKDDLYSPPPTPTTPEVLKTKSPEPKKKKRDKEKKKKSKDREHGVEKERVKESHKEREKEKIKPEPPVVPIVEKRPKTPEIVETPTSFPYFPPGLIPTPLNNPLMPHFPLMTPNFPNVPLPPPHFMHPVPPPKPDPSMPIAAETNPSASAKSPLAILLDREKKNKEHKKDKKEKKVKKDKKDKPKKDKKDKDKHEKHKSKDKKEKKEKRKDKDRDKEKEREKTKEIVPVVVEVPPPKEPEPIAVPKLTLKLPPTEERGATPPKIVEVVKPREPSPEGSLGRFSSLFANKPSTSKLPEVKPMQQLHVSTELKTPKDAPPLSKSPGTIIDKDGNQVWICPACNRPDDGTPMIGCDQCDGWYHWVCVGIQVPPDENEDWYCRFCIVKNQTSHEKKKRGRKRKPPI